MAIEVHARQLRCTTSGAIFGPIFHTDDDAEDFRSWCYDALDTDPRRFHTAELYTVARVWSLAHGRTEPTRDAQYMADATRHLATQWQKLADAAAEPSPDEFGARCSAACGYCGRCDR